MVVFPFCKINLGLNIISKRPDGYHNLETCFYPLPFCDALEVIPASEFKFVVTGITVTGDTEDNLCVKAYRLLAQQHQLPPVYMHLHKAIPSGAGLAGGSSDATHTLLLLNKKFNLGLDHPTLLSYAAQLGSDCPFFLHQQPMLGSGRGELLQPVNISLTGYRFLLVIPGVHISTQQAFSGITPRVPEQKISDIIESPAETWKDHLVNDFEYTVFEQFPELRQIKETLYHHGAIYASLTGSGSVVYGIFKQEAGLKEIAGLFSDQYTVKII